MKCCSAGDLLTCVGVVDAIKDLRRMPGLSIAEDQGYTLNLKHTQRQLVEIVLSATSPLINRTVRESGFRDLYGAAIISISREGGRIPGKVGDIVFRPGDTLLVEAGATFRREAQVQPRLPAGERPAGFGAAGFPARAAGARHPDADDRGARRSNGCRCSRPRSSRRA